MANPKISIITAVYNGGKFLEDLIISIINQTYKDIEFVIIDGGSSDNTIEIINKYINNINKFISEPDNGIYDAWNKGVDLSSGEWLCFIGSDDHLLPDAIQNYVDFIADHKTDDLEYISSKVILTDEYGNDLSLWGEAWDWKVFRWNMKVAHVGSLHNRSLFTKYGKFNDQYKIAGDYEFLLRPGSSLSAGYLNLVTAKMRNGGVSNNDFRAYKEAIKAKYETGKRPFIKTILDFLYIYTAVNIKRLIQSLRF